MLYTHLEEIKNIFEEIKLAEEYTIPGHNRVYKRQLYLSTDICKAFNLEHEPFIELINDISLIIEGRTDSTFTYIDGQGNRVEKKYLKKEYMPAVYLSWNQLKCLKTHFLWNGCTGVAIYLNGDVPLDNMDSYHIIKDLKSEGYLDDWFNEHNIRIVSLGVNRDYNLVEVTVGNRHGSMGLVVDEEVFCEVLTIDSLQMGLNNLYGISTPVILIVEKTNQNYKNGQSASRLEMHSLEPGLIHESKPAYSWKGHAFRSEQEVRVAKALDNLGVFFFPNAGCRVSEGDIRKTLEVDFLIILDGNVGVLEVDGKEYHRSVNKDVRRDINFKKEGAKFIQRYNYQQCLNPQKVVIDFLGKMNEFYNL
jgi:hypothetical protein